MVRIIALAIVAGMAIVQLSITNAQTEQNSVRKAGSDSASAVSDLGSLPPLPRGKSTVIGGEIRDVDPVLDRFTLRVFGGKPIKILFDERTQLFRDGSKVSLRELGPNSQASIQTTLDGAAVFAVSIHILSQSPQGSYQGGVLSYNPTTGELTLGAGLGGEPFKVSVSKDTKFARGGQSNFVSVQSGPSDLQKGALVSITFDPDNKGHGVATRITLLATPGSAFAFSGNLSAIDFHTAQLVLVDPRDDTIYQISFDPTRIAAAQNLHPGQRVRVTAEYDGIRYSARDIVVY